MANYEKIIELSTYADYSRNDNINSYSGLTRFKLPQSVGTYTKISTRLSQFRYYDGKDTDHKVNCYCVISKNGKTVLTTKKVALTLTDDYKTVSFSISLPTDSEYECTLYVEKTKQKVSDNRTGIVFSKATATLTATPKVEITEPRVYENYARKEKLTVKWKIETPGAVTKQELTYGSTKVTVSNSKQEYVIPANALSLGSNKIGITITGESGIFNHSIILNIGATCVISSLNAPSTTRWAQPFNVSWSYSSSISSIRTAKHQFRYAYYDFYTGTYGNWTTLAAVDSTANSLTVPARYFGIDHKPARVKVSVRLCNEDGVWSDWAEKEVNIGVKPTIKWADDNIGTTVKRSVANTIKWVFSDSLDSGQYSYWIVVKKANGDIVIGQDITSSNNYYTIPANTLEKGEYTYQLRVTNNDTIYSDWITGKVSVGAVSTVNIISPEDKTDWRITDNNTVSWTHTDTLGVGQKAFELGYSYNGSSYTSVSGTTATSYTFAANTFHQGSITLRLKIQNNDNIWTDYIYRDITIGSVPTVSLGYPLDCTIKSSIAQIFTWAVTESIPASGVAAQKSYELGISSDGGSTWTTYTETTNRQSKTFAASTFTAGTYRWRLKVTSNDNITTSAYVYGEFIVVGQTEAPEITNVTASAIPTVTWTISSQDTFEFELYNSVNERIYASGVQKGYNIRSYTPNIMLEDGAYSIKMRAMNTYGYFTEWITYSFILETEKPDAVTCYAFANEFYGVTIARSLELDAVEPTFNPSTSPTPDAIYVLRRMHGTNEWDIIGKLSTEDETVTFTDNTPVKDVQYEYCLRNYAEEAGYTDSNVQLIKLDYKGALVYDGNDYVQMILSENETFSISHSPSKSFNYTYMLGRPYPVRESSEWLGHSTALSAFIDFEQYAKLERFLASNDDLWFKGKDFSYMCVIDSLQISNAHFDKGYDVQLTVTRINEEEFDLL